MKNTLRFSLALAAAALILAGCGSSPTEPRNAAPPNTTPVAYEPRKPWTGTFTGVSIPCNSSASVYFPTNGLPPNYGLVACLRGESLFVLSLTRSGNALTGYAAWGDGNREFPEFYPITGTLTDSAMDLTIFNDTVDFPNGPTGPMGTLHLHP